MHNARRLDIDLTTVDAIVLSHGHYDHTGGLKQAMEHGARAPLYLHPQAVIRRYSGKPATAGRSAWHR
ncbi:MAG: MBL fold metallo-hydrolase [Phycisphaerales bacterium]|nr:MBL fold metallo-hydrolase [Phycisphaerales bacterium]